MPQNRPRAAPLVPLRLFHALCGPVFFSLLTWLAGVAQLSAQVAVPGDVDPGFNAAIVGNHVRASAMQPDGKVIIAGRFSSVLGVPRNHIARLNADGSLDMGFDPNANDEVKSVTVQPDGKILLAGEFTTLQPNGAASATSRQYVARVNADGSLDMGFDPKASNHLFSVAVQPDGKILLGGAFFWLQPNGAPATTERRYVARVNADGSLDASFDPKANSHVYDLAIQDDGKILIAGAFTTLEPNGTAAVTRQYIARVNADGTLDTGFDPKTNNSVLCVVVQPDSKILLAGSFTTLQPNGAAGATSRQSVARINANGSLDASFDPKANNSVITATLQADGKILLGGDFTTLQPNGAPSPTSRNRIARVNADGSLDTGFDPNANAYVLNAALQADGRILLGGLFTTLQPNGAASPTTRNYLARLFNGTATQTLTVPDSSQVQWQLGGTYPALSQVTFEKSIDGGTNWSSLGNGTRVGTTANWQLTGLSLPASGQVRARGRTTDGSQNGSSGLVESVQPFSGLAVPTVATTAARSISSSTATVTGTVNPNNQATTVTFEYGLTTSYGASVPATLAPVSGTNTLAVSAVLTDLTPETTYHFRIKGVNSGGGIATGSDQTFTTSSTRFVPNQLLFSIPAPSVGTQAGTEFGTSVAVDGGYTVVGVPQDDIGATNAGVVKVYNTVTGALLYLLPNPAPASTDHFGFSVAISGTRVIIGAYSDDAGANDSGTAYVYDLSGASPTVPTMTLNNPGPAASDEFGYAVTISGRYAAVAAWQDDTGATNAGSVYVYDLDSSTPTTPLLTIANPAPATTDQFGNSISLSGTRLIVGAWKDDLGASDAGSAYVYDFTSSTPTTPVVTLNNPGPAASDLFGRSVAISGTRAVVGCRDDDTSALNAGIAYVYDLTSGTPAVPTVTLNNPSPTQDDQFGTAVAITGTTVIVGAYLDDAGANDAGTVYVFDIGSGTPTVPTQTISNISPGPLDWFGYSLAISGTRLVSSAYLDDTSATDAGSVYIYDLVGGTPAVPTAILNNASPSTGDWFGTRVGLSGNLMVVGASREDTAAADAGSAYVYDLASATPTVPAFILHNPSPAASDNFGYSVAISGTRVVVGAWWKDVGVSDAGAAYIYDLSSGTPTVPIYTLNNPSPAIDDYFGWAVAIDGTRVVVGAYQDDTGGTNAGSAYVYDLASATPTVPLATLNNPGPGTNDWFGYSVAVSGNRVAVGAYQDDTAAANSGSAYVYDLSSGTPTVPVHTLANPGPATDDQFGFSVAISGKRLVVSANADDTGAANAGIAYVFDLTSGTPTVPAYTLNRITPLAGDDFGYSVSIAGTRIAVGADGADGAVVDCGRAFLYDLAGSNPTLPQAIVENPTPATLDTFGYSVSVDGERTAIGAYLDDTSAVDKGAAYVFGPSSTPEIAVEVLGGESLTDGASTLNFGFSAVGVGSQRIIRVTNQSSVPLSGLTLSKDGTNAADFTLGAPGSATLAPGASTTFNITFTPPAAISRMAALHIASNDPDESPFDVTLTGAGQPGSLDLTYDPQMVGGIVNDAIELPNGKLMIGGEFESVGGVVQRNLARLNADGSVDTTFALAVTGTVYCFAIQSDGKLLIGGSFTVSSNGQSRSNFVRLNTDGSLDATMPNLSVGLISAIVVQTDGKIVIGGQFSGILGQVRSNIGRIQADGTLDSGYNPNALGSVDAMALQSDGKVIIGGQFTTVGSTARNRAARLNTDGTVDPGFDPNVNSRVYSIAVQTDGKVILAGQMTTVGVTTRNRIARVNADGTLDTGYNPNVNGTIYRLELQSDGRLVVGGSFTTVLGSLSRRNLLRLSTDGGVDSGFKPDPDGIVNAATQLSGDRLLIGGSFSRLVNLPRSLYAILDGTGTSVLTDTGAGASGGMVFAQSVMSDRSLMVAGGYLQGAGATPGMTLMKLHPDGRLNTTFNANLSTSAWSYNTVAQADGKVISQRGTTVVGRHQVDGSLDSSFTTASASNPIYSLAMQADGKVLVGGNFTTLAGTTRNNIGRLNANGTLDTGFNPNASSLVYSIAVQSDGKIIIGGEFATIGGVTRNRLARLNADGTLDNSFDPNAGNNVYAILVQPDGKILVGGYFTTIGGVTRNHVARLNPDGTVDSFNPNVGGNVLALALQTNGQILLGGPFTTIGSVMRRNVARVDANGILDSNFVADVDGTYLYSITQTDDGGVLLGGRFSSVNGVARNGLARVANAPAMQSLTTNIGGTAVNWLRAGTSPEVDRVTFESSLDGTTWSSLGSGTRVTNGWQLTGLTLPAGQSYRVRARGWQMTGGYYGGDSSLYETVAIIPSGPAAPEIAVEQPPGTSLADGASTTDFGGVDLGASADVTYTVRNTGSADLTGIAVTIDGPHAAEFSLVSSPAPAIPAGGSSILTVRHAPGGFGSRFANLHLYSNDADESPFDVTLTGFGKASSSPIALANIVGGFVREFARNPDGKLWVAGNFDQIGGGVRTDLARLNADGTLDPVINHTGFGGSIEALLVQADGKLLFGGDFSGPNGSNLRRLNLDGTLDATFTPSAGSVVTSLGQQTSGKLIIAGSFTSLGGQTRNRIGRLNLNGTLDTSFNPDANGTIECLLVLADDTILIGGSFTTIGGVTRNRIARLNADGTLDTSFDPNANSSVISLLLQSDGKLLLGGTFTTIGAATRNRIARLNTDGTLDTGFDGNLNNTVSTMVQQADGKIVIGGVFTTAGGITRNRLARLNTDGSLDNSYNPDINSSVNGIILNADGNLMAGGFFTTVGGVTRNRVARIQASGALDASLDSNCNGAFIFATVQQADGKTLVGGWFTHVNNVARNHIARLNADGSLDMDFDPNASGEVYSLACQPDGQILVGGFFTSMGGFTRNRIARLYPNGTVDAAFNPNANNLVYALVVEPSGGILMAGTFTALAATPRNRIARVSSSGVVDTTFDPNANGTIFGLALQPDTRIVLSGSFTTVGGATRNRLARIEPDGSLDTSFNPNANATVLGVQVEADGRMLVHGFFTTIGGLAQANLARLDEDGTLVTDFDAIPDGAVAALSRQVSGNVALAGTFNTINQSGTITARNRLAMVAADGALNPLFNPDASFSMYSLALTKDGQVLAGGLHSALGGVAYPKLVRLNSGTPASDSLSANTTSGIITWARTGGSPEVDRVTFEASVDGNSWTPVGNGTRVDYGWDLWTPSLPAGQTFYLRARGYQMTGGYYGGDGSVYESVARSYRSAANGPEIAVEQPAGTGLTSALSEVDFGGVDIGSSRDLVFTIKNTGAAPLTGLAVTFDGAVPTAEYSLVSPPSSPVAALGGETTFTVRFSPTDFGSRPGAVQIWSSDADESPFHINLEGSGNPTAVSLSTNSIVSGSAAPVILQVDSIPIGNSITVDRYVDANGNGTDDPDEWLVESFVITDGQVSSIGGVRNTNVPGDEDLVADGHITVHLNPDLGPELGRLCGSQVVLVWEPSGATFAPVNLPLTITEPSSGQSVAGVVTDGTDPVPYAGVLFINRDADTFIAGAVADSAGRFALKVPSGVNCKAFAVRSGYVADLNTAPVLMAGTGIGAGLGTGGGIIGGGTTITQNLQLIPATTSISGSIVDVSATAQVGGVQLIIESDDGKLTAATSMPGFGGYYAPVTTGHWEVEASEYSARNLGYVQFDASVSADTTTGPASGIDVGLLKATALIYGTVKNNLGTPLSDVEITGEDQPGLYDALGRSAAPNGMYAVGVVPGVWNVAVATDAVPDGYTTASSEVTLGAGQAVQADLVLNAITARLRGQVRDDSGAPIPNITLVLQKLPFSNGGAGSIYPRTDANGNFDLGAYAGIWNIALECVEAQRKGFVEVADLDFTVVDGVDQNGIVLTFPRSTFVITGTVKDDLGNPIAGVELDAFGEFGGNRYIPGCVETDGNGRYMLKVINGMWEVAVRAGDLEALGFDGTSPQAVVIANTNGIAHFVASPNAVPSLASVFPADGASGVARNSTIGFTFSEPMDRGFSIAWSPNVNANDFSNTWSDDRKTILFTYNGALPANATIGWTLNPSGDPPNFTDLVGNPLASDTAGSFTTGTDPGTDPMLVIEQAGAGIPHGGSKAFGAVAAGGGALLTFVVKNTGTGALWLDASPKVAISGADASSFAIVKQPDTVLTGVAGTSTFLVRFAPLTAGSKSALVSIPNSTDQDPFEFTVTGTGIGALNADNYADRISLGSSDTVNVTGSNVGATLEAGEKTFGNITGASVWAEWTAPYSGWFTLHTVGSRFDTVLSLYKGAGTLGSLDVMGFNDTSGRGTDWTSSFNYGISRLVFFADAGTTYAISVGGGMDGSSADMGSFELHIAADAPPIRVMGIGFAPNSVDVTASAQATALSLSVESDAPLFPGSYLNANILRPDQPLYGNGIYAFFSDNDRIAGNNTNGTYQTSLTIPRYVAGGPWPVSVFVQSAATSYLWTLPGDDLVNDDYLIPEAASSTLSVINTGPVDSAPPTLVSVTGFPAVVDVTSGPVTFDIDITFSDDVAGLDDVQLYANSEFSSYSLSSLPSGGTIISGNAQSGVLRVPVTIWPTTESGTYYPDIWLNDAAVNKQRYTDGNGWYGDRIRISPAGSDLTFQVVGTEPEIEVKAPNGSDLADNTGVVDFGSGNIASTAVSYDFTGNFATEFSPSENSGAGVLSQSGGVLQYHTSGISGYSTAIYQHNGFHPSYNQSWAVEANVTVPAALDGTLASTDAYIDNGLVVAFTANDGTLYHLHTTLTLEPERKYQTYYSATLPNGDTFELDYGHDVPTTDESGVVRVRFDAATKILTAETDSQTIFTLDVSAAGWGITNADTFNVGLDLTVDGASIPNTSPLRIDDFRAALTSPGLAQTFTITNTGLAGLSRLRLSKDGPNAGDFAVSQSELFFLPANASATFTVTFTPSGAGPRTAVLHIASNDADENPFEIALAGTGVNAPPTAVTLAALDVTRTTALLRGFVNSNGLSTSVSFDFGLTTSYGSTAAATPGTIATGLDTGVSAILSGLTPGATYHYRVRATSTLGTTLGADLSFTTPLSQAGDRDLAFGATSDERVQAIAIQPDGRILIGGTFTRIGGSNRRFLARLTATGALDAAFNPSVDGAITAIVVQDDGRIIISGDTLNTVNGTARKWLARLNADGALDAAFNPNPDSAVPAVLLLPDGKLIVGGDFHHIGGGAIDHIARLNSNGTLDGAFNPTTNGPVLGLALAPDGKVCISGGFTTVNGSNRPRLARLAADGTLDSGFTANLDNTINGIQAQANGKLLIHGNFTMIDGISRRWLARLHPSGSLDAGFLPEFNAAIEQIAVQVDGKVIAVGAFRTVNGSQRNYIARLLSDGTIDESFNANSNQSQFFDSWAAASVYSLAIQKDGRIVVGGDFNDTQGTKTGRVRRLLNDAAAESLAAVSQTRVEWLRSGSGPQLRDVAFELSSNGGNTWTSLGAATRITGGWGLDVAPLSSSGQLRARGRTASADVNTSSWTVETVAAFSGFPTADIAVFNGAGTTPANERTDNGGVFNFGPLLLGTSATQTFTIQNAGTVALGNIALSLGAGAGEFNLSPPAASALAPGATAAFTVTFAPTAAGVQNRTVLIASDDADESPFEIQITGHGQVPPAITEDPTSRFIGWGQSGSLTVSATGTALQYEWLHNGSPIAGANAATLSIPNASLGDAGVWKIRVFNGVGSITSVAAHVGVVDLRPATKALKAGETLTLDMLAAAPGAVYRWLKGGVAVARGINPEAKLVLTDVQLSQAGNYSLEVTMPDAQNPTNLMRLQSGVISVSITAVTAVSVTRRPPSVMVPPALGPWIVGGTVSETLTALNQPTRFSVVGLPAGVVLNPTNGRLSGSPTTPLTAPKRYSLTVRALNASHIWSAPVKTDVLVQPLPGYTTGTFTGLIAPAAVNDHLGGSFVLILGTTGSYSGRLTLGAAVHSFAGRLRNVVIGENVIESLSVKRGAKQMPLLVEFEIDRFTGRLDGGTGVDFGTLTAITAWHHRGTGFGYVGDHSTTLLNPSNQTSAGTLRITVRAAGLTTWVGRLSDRSTFTGSAFLGLPASVPLHHLLYRNSGSVQGWLNLDPLSGQLEELTKSTAPDLPPPATSLLVTPVP